MNEIIKDDLWALETLVSNLTETAAQTVEVDEAIQILISSLTKTK